MDIDAIDEENKCLNETRRIFVSRKWATVSICVAGAFISSFYAFDRLESPIIEMIPLLLFVVVYPLSYHDNGFIYRGSSRKESDTVLAGLKLAYTCIVSMLVFLIIFWIVLRIASLY